MLVEAPVVDRARSYVVIPGGDLGFCIDVTCVQNVVAESDWKGSAPVRLDALWGREAAAPRPSDRLVVVRTPRATCAVVAPSLSYRSVAPEQIASVPWLVGHARAASLITGIVFPAGEPPLVILHPEAVVRSAAGASVWSRDASS